MISVFFHLSYLLSFLLLFLSSFISGEEEGEYTTDRVKTGLNETCTNYLRGSWSGTNTEVIVEDLTVGEAYVYMEDINRSYFNNSISNIHPVYSNVYVRKGNYTDDKLVFLYGPGEYYPKTGRYMLKLSTGNNFDINTVYGFDTDDNPDNSDESNDPENPDNPDAPDQNLELINSQKIEDKNIDNHNEKVNRKSRSESNNTKSNNFAKLYGLFKSSSHSNNKNNMVGIIDDVGLGVGPRNIGKRNIKASDETIHSISYYGLNAELEWPPKDLIKIDSGNKTEDLDNCSFVFYGQLNNYTTPTVHYLPDHYRDGDSYSDKRITYIEGNRKLMMVPSSFGTLISNNCGFLVDIQVSEVNSTPSVEEGYVILTILILLEIGYTYVNFRHYKTMIENMVYVRQVSTAYSILNSLITGIVAITILTNTYFMSLTFFASIPPFILLAGNLTVIEIQCVLIGMRRHHINRCAMIFAIIGYLVILILILVLQYYLPMYVIDSVISALLLAGYLSQIIHNAKNKFKTPFSILYLIISPTTRILFYVYSAFFTNYLGFTPYMICGIILLVCAYVPVIFLIIQKFSMVLTKEGLKEDEKKIPASLIIRLLGEFEGSDEDEENNSDGAIGQGNNTGNPKTRRRTQKLEDNTLLLDMLDAESYSSSSVNINTSNKKDKNNNLKPESSNTNVNNNPNMKEDSSTNTSDSSSLVLDKNYNNNSIVSRVKKNLETPDEIVLYLPVEQDVRDDVIVRHCVNESHYHNQIHANSSNSKCIIPLTLRQAQEMTTCSICLENINMLLIQGKYLTPSVNKKSIDRMDKIRHKLIKLDRKLKENDDISGDNEETEGDKDSNDVTVTVCSHIFHTTCLDNWMKIKIECPICRHEL